MDSTRRVAHYCLKLPVYWVSVLALLWPMAAGAQHEEPTIAVCNDCSSAFQYSQAAIEAAPLDTFPSGSADVYVVNLVDLDTLAYRVTRTMIDPDPAIFGDETFEANATPIDGDPVLMAELADTLQGMEAFFDAIVQDIPGEELDLPFDSALDLVGGGEGDANRIRLQQALENRFNQTFSQFAVHFNNFVRMTGSFFGVQNAFPGPGNGFVRINFPDGTTLRARVETAPDPTDNGVDLEFDIDIDMESIQAPDGQFIPLTSGHLSGFELTTPDPGIRQALRDLLRRLGADVEPLEGGSPPGGSCTTTTCVATTEDGFTLYFCSESVSSC